MKRFVILAALAAVISSAFVAETTAQVPLDKKKFSVVHVGAEWCGPCHYLEEHVWPDARVQQLLMQYHGENYWKVDADRDPDFCQAYQIKGLPTILIMDEKGIVYKRMMGQCSPEQMVDFLSTVPAEPQKHVLIIGSFFTLKGLLIIVFKAILFFLG